MMVMAPGVVKLLGEHAVVYGRLSLAVGINIYAKASVHRARAGFFEIEMPELKIDTALTRDDIDALYKSYKSKKSMSGYVKPRKTERALPFATIAARLFNEFGIDPIGKRIRLVSGIPVQKGLASSAALSTAFTVALVRSSKTKLKDSDIIDVARDGERVIHLNENAGRIDVSTSFYGGITAFSTESGAKKEKVDVDLDLLVIDTGPKKSTAETVGHVALLYKKNRRNTSAIFDRIHGISERGLDAIRNADIDLLGNLMYDNHELLKKLGVSSKGLDLAVKTAREHGARGAKLSGGGGGGIAIALLGRNKKQVTSVLKRQGFKVLRIKVSKTGARDYLRH